MTATPPTSETITAVAEVLKLAAFLDDRIGGADKGRIMAWATQVQRHELTSPDLLDGLQAFYDGPSTHAMGIGDLIQQARKARRERNEAEEARVSEERAQRNDAKVADDLTAISAAALSRPRRTTPRLDAARAGLQTCQGKAAARAAIGEYFAAVKDANKTTPTHPASTLAPVPALRDHPATPDPSERP